MRFDQVLLLRGSKWYARVIFGQVSEQVVLMHSVFLPFPLERLSGHLPF